MPESFDPKPRRVALLGIGKAAGAFPEGWDRHGCERQSAFDVKSDQPATRGWVEERCRHLTPVLLAGPHADAASRALASLGMRPGVADDQVGQASTIKMVRSVMIKGIEALTAECMLAARRAGVADAVLASLQASDASTDWRARASYNLERMMVHGGRRAAEMREVARTVAELGISDRMSRATAEWQQAIGDLGLEGGEDLVEDRADRILAALDPSHSRIKRDS